MEKLKLREIIACFTWLANQVSQTDGAMSSSGLRSSKLSNYDTDDTSTNL